MSTIPITTKEHYEYLKEFTQWLESHWDEITSDTSFEMMENKFKDYYEMKLADEQAEDRYYDKLEGRKGRRY